MDLHEHQKRGWLYTCTVEERQAIFGTVQRWVSEIGQRTDLEPLESRQQYRILAEELTTWPRRGTDPGLERQWRRLGPTVQARWVGGVGTWLPCGSPGFYAAQIIRRSLDPPRFRSIHPMQQRNLLGQIAGEIEGYLGRDPEWFKQAAFRTLARAARGLEQQGDSQVCSAEIHWDHLDRPQRAGVLRDIAAVARLWAAPKRLAPTVRENLHDLIRSATAVGEIYRPRGLIRE